MGTPEWCLALFLGSCLFGWWTVDEFRDACRNPSLHHEPLPIENAYTYSPFTMSELGASDESTLYNMSGFEFLTQASCLEEYLIVVTVVSAPYHWRRRIAIRQTWGASFKLVFLLGLQTGWTHSYANEHSKYGDLVVGNFLDNYKNLTYKNLMALKWVIYKCPSARYVLKVDDDVIIDPVRLQEFVHKELSPLGSRNLLLCHVMDSVDKIVHRSGRSKYRVSRAQYPAQYYPKFCKGAVTFLSPDVVFKLYAKVQRRSVPYVSLQDVFITGHAASQTNITHSEIGYHLNSRVEVMKYWECPFKDRKHLFICIYDSLPGTVLKVLWKSVADSYNEIPFVSGLPRISNDSASR